MKFNTETLTEVATNRHISRCTTLSAGRSVSAILNWKYVPSNCVLCLSKQTCFCSLDNGENDIHACSRWFLWEKQQQQQLVLNLAKICSLRSVTSQVPSKYMAFISPWHLKCPFTSIRKVVGRGLANKTARQKLYLTEKGSNFIQLVYKELAMNNLSESVTRSKCSELQQTYSSKDHAKTKKCNNKATQLNTELVSILWKKCTESLSF